MIINLQNSIRTKATQTGTHAVKVSQAATNSTNANKEQKIAIIHILY